jgi:hypothetical protein
MVLRSESRVKTAISLVIIHTNEGDHKPNMPDDHTAENLAAYLDRANAAEDWKSYHLICDDDSTVRYVPDDQAAWSARSANKRSLNICFTGWAHWTSDEWAAHLPMLRRGASEVAKWCGIYTIPTDKLTPAQVTLDQYGICGHWDWTVGKRDGTHTDPGLAFPWSLFIDLVRGEDMKSDERDALFDVRAQLAGVGPLGKYVGWPARPDTTTDAKTMVDYIRALHAEQRAQRAILDEIRSKLR